MTTAEATVMSYFGQRLRQPTIDRKAIRWPVAIPVTVSGSCIGHYAAEVRDVSRTGCLIEMQCKFGRNDLVLITIPSLGPLATRVVWSNGLETGVKFNRPLSLSVLEMVAGRHGREGDVDF